MSPIATFLVFFVAMVLAYGSARLLTGVSARLALRWGIVSRVTHRSSHTRATPRLGGLGLSGAFGLTAAGFLAALWFAPHSGAMIGFEPTLVLWCGLGWLLMLGVGLLDDVSDLPALVKLALMTVAALAPTVGGRIAPELPAWWLLPTWFWEALGVALAMGWILFFTNAYNFMDGMDGFAAAFARNAALFMFMIVLLAGQRAYSLNAVRAEAYLLPLLAMACWGFMWWNRPPARVFMGDGGSLSVGYLLAIYPLLGRQGALGAVPGSVELNIAPLISLTLLLPFVFDVLLTLMRRARRGENLLEAHREHLYQRLMRAGLSHGQVLRMNVWRFAVCGGLALLASLWRETWVHALALTAALGLMLHYWRVTLRCERAP